MDDFRLRMIKKKNHPLLFKENKLTNKIKKKSREKGDKSFKRNN